MVQAEVWIEGEVEETLKSIDTSLKSIVGGLEEIAAELHGIEASHLLAVLDATPNLAQKGRGGS